MPAPPPPTSSLASEPPAGALPPSDDSDTPGRRLGLIEQYIEWTSGVPAPEIFRLWMAISAVGAIVERKVWLRTGPANFLYPNTFVFLVGPPGTGKTQAMVPMTNALRKAEVLRMAPNDMTKQSLLDRLGEKASVLSLPGPPPVIIDYHALYIVSRELSNFMSQYDGDLAGLLTDLFDCPPENDEQKRSHNRGRAIVKPTLSLIAGTATKNLGKTISGDLWGQGFMSRVILVHSAEQHKVDIFAFENDELAVSDYNPSGVVPSELVETIREIAKLKGPIRWAEAAREAFNHWRMEKNCEPVPRHSKLVEYAARRWLHVAKLSMISALSDLRMTVELEDFRRGKMWLEQAEAGMPEIFREMATHSDGEVLREFHHAMWQLAATRPGKLVRYEDMVAWLSQRVASRDVERMIVTATDGGWFGRTAGTQGSSATYRPLPKFDGYGDDEL